MSEEWDTSGNTEGEADPYNKSQFAGGSSGEESSAPAPAPAAAAPPAPEPVAPPAAVEETSESLSKMAVSDVATEAPPAALNISAPAPSAAPAGASTASPSSGGSGSKSPRKPSLAPQDAPDFLKKEHGGAAFTEKLDAEALAFFNELCEKPFAEQATAFLNAYWAEVGSQAPFIFEVAYKVIRQADMHAKGINYIHLYDEGNEMDFNIGLYFYEKLNKLVYDDDEGSKWRDDPQWKDSMPTMMTAIKRKIELRDNVDVNFDGKITMLEYLLYQYKEHANPADFTHRAMKVADFEEHPEIVKARNALAEVNAAIQAYEAEKHRLTELAKLPGVKGLGAKHQLAILDASPLAETLNQKLITAEAAVRIATRKFGNGKVPANTGAGETTTYNKPTDGSVWWLNRDLEEKKKLYGRRGK